MQLSIRGGAMVAAAICAIAGRDVTAQSPARRAPADPRIVRLKQDLVREIDGMRGLSQQMVDAVFSYGELGFQEEETSKYLKGILRSNGFTIEEGIAGIPTSWVANWGSGKPVIALGSDIDGIPQASQKPGVAYHDPLVAGAPGHGEGHNSGVPLNITAALALKKVMEREKLPGTLKIWPGVAEELVGAKAYYVRAGVFKDVDISLFAHVASNLGTSWGQGFLTGLISAEFKFQGTSAHAAGAPWRGRSALDAVELMDVGWNFRREHLRTQQRSHYVIRDGGDQPNVVPSTASVWYYLREVDYDHINELFQIATEIAEGAAKMTGTKFLGARILGSAWPIHGNRTIAETMYENVKQVGLPTWDAADEQLAKAVQCELGVPQAGLDTALMPLQGDIPKELLQGGPSDDIGDVSWNVPTAVLYYPSNIPNLPGHHWSNAIAMATPLAHKGVTAGAKTQAMTVLDFLLSPKLVADAWDYFRNVQTKDVKYRPFIRPEDQPATEMNANILARYRPEMRKYYYDPSKYKSYLEQLGITYPTTHTCTRTPTDE